MGGSWQLYAASSPPEFRVPCEGLSWVASEVPGPGEAPVAVL